MFLDTVNTPTIPKKLRWLSAQGPGESRRQWHHVTEALKKQDMEAASDAKHMVETLIGTPFTVYWQAIFDGG